MKVEKVSFSYKGIKPKETVDLGNPFLYTSNFSHKTPDRPTYNFVTALVAATAVIITLINIKKTI